jgi:hypothetical protein
MPTCAGLGHHRRLSKSAFRPDAAPDNKLMLPAGPEFCRQRSDFREQRMGESAI